MTIIIIITIVIIIITTVVVILLCIDSIQSMAPERAVSNSTLRWAPMLNDALWLVPNHRSRR
eukprot:12333281-Karenia_brevis.AAC.1